MQVPRRLEPADRAPPHQAGIDWLNLVERDRTRQDLDGGLLTDPAPVIAAPADMPAPFLLPPGLTGLVAFDVVHHPATTGQARLDQRTARDQAGNQQYFCKHC
jgi:hypothetical protein